MEHNIKWCKMVFYICFNGTKPVTGPDHIMHFLTMAMAPE